MSLELIMRKSEGNRIVPALERYELKNSLCEFSLK